MTPPSPSSNTGELTIHKDCRGVILYYIMTVIFFISVSAAIFNLLQHQVIIPSLIWLLLVGWLIFDAIKADGGFHRWLVRSAGMLAGRYFLAVVGPPGMPAAVQIGYEIFGRRTYLKVRRRDSQGVSARNAHGVLMF